MAASWAPSVADVTGLVNAWNIAADETLINGLIGNATNEVIAEVGDFDPTEVINPSADVADQVTLANLAADAAAIRAAHMWASSIAPEFNDPEFVRSLYARFVDALARLRSRVGTSDVEAPFTIRPYGEPGYTTASEDWS